MFVYKAPALISIIPLSATYSAAIEVLLDAAFGADRYQRTAYKIRAGMVWLPALSFAALDEAGALVGSLQSWPVALHLTDGTQHALTLVGPVAVDPARQRNGIGRGMMNALMREADRGVPGSEAMVMIGDPDYYERLFGFSAALTSAWSTPGPVERHRLLARITPDGVLPDAGMLGPRAG